MTDYKFTPNQRLLKADEFSSVFLLRKVRSGAYFKVYFKPNSLDTSRLGLIVSKKVHKRSNKRNYIKRTLRELFRLNYAAWKSHDIIIRVHKKFIKEDLSQVKMEFLNLTKSFRIKC